MKKEFNPNLNMLTQPRKLHFSLWVMIMTIAWFDRLHIEYMLPLLVLSMVAFLYYFMRLRNDDMRCPCCKGELTSCNKAEMDMQCTFCNAHVFKRIGQYRVEKFGHSKKSGILGIHTKTKV